MARKYTKRQAEKQARIDSGSAALYIRVSTELQADEGNSLDAQRDKMIAHCQGKGWAVDEDHIYVDAGISGKSTARPAFQRMLDAARAGEISRIVVTKRDRLARNTVDFLNLLSELQGLGCDLVCLDFDFDSSTPTGKLIATIFAGFAEWEASLITDRVMTGKAQNAKQGGYNGSRCPMGYSYQGNGEFTTTDRAATVQRIFERFNAGASLNAIARELNGDGTPTATGKGKWTPYGVSHILRNGFYAGLAEWDGVRGVEGNHPAIISRADYEQAQAVLSTMRRGQRVDLVEN